MLIALSYTCVILLDFARSTRVPFQNNRLAHSLALPAARSSSHQAQLHPARARSARARRACALRALGLLLADGTPTGGRGEDFLSRQPDFFTETAVTPERKVEKSFPRWEINRHVEG